MWVSTCDPRFDAPSTRERGGRMAPPTGLENAHVPCIGVTLLWRAKKPKKQSPGSRQNEVQMGKTQHRVLPLETLIHRNLFFSQAHEVEPPGPS